MKRPDDRPVIAALLAVAFAGLAIMASNLVQEPVQPESWDTIWIAVTGAFTVVLAISTIALWWATKAAGARADSAIRTIERAYVKMSHYPPGLNIEDASGMCWVKLQVKNFGHTPARVIDAFVTVKVLPNNEPISANPVYKTNLITSVYRVFLVTGDEATYYPTPFNIGPSSVSDLRSGALNLWLIGHVDYLDMFGRQYRAGYARMYRYEVDMRALYPNGGIGDEAYANRNNLVFVTEEGYNYDICLDESAEPRCV